MKKTSRDKEASRKKVNSGGAARKSGKTHARAQAEKKAAQPQERGISKRFPIVGIGASAGGLEAFTELLKHLPLDTGMGFVLVQHLDPQHESILPQLLSRATEMPVRVVTDNQRVEPDHVYVIPPNSALSISRGSLKLRARERRSGKLHHPIDAFLGSLAEDQRECAIGIILSGTAFDGTLGLEAIKAEGGITLVQDDSAKYDSMPRSAIAAGCVDFVLPPERMAQELGLIARHPLVTDLLASEKEREAGQREGREVPLASGGKGTPRTGSSQARAQGAALSDKHLDSGYPRVLRLLNNHCGVDFSLYKSTTIQRRIGRRMVLNRKNKPTEYAQLLQGNAKELDALYSDVLISVTSFFRNPDAFQALKETVFAKLLERNRRDDPVRVWTLGCSTGQEAYSIAMAYAEFADNTPHAPKLQIFATDLNERLLEKARNGLYSRSLAEDVSRERLSRFFVEQDGGYRVSKTLRESCIFARQNVLSDPPFSRMDLISCRNLLIYLEPDLQQRIIPNFHYALKPGGFLFLGASESIGSFTNLFEIADKQQKIFARKLGPVPGYQLPVSGSHPAKHRTVVPGARPEAEPESFRGELNAQREADRLMVNEFAPPSVLVNADMEVLQFRGATGEFLEPPVGKATFNVLKMAREGLMLPLRSALQKARQENKPVAVQGARFSERGKGGPRRVNLRVVPLKNLKECCYLILFELADGTKRAAPTGPLVDPPSAAENKALPSSAKQAIRRIAELERELGEARDYAQAIQEQHEAAAEEHQAANEEVQSANEELQSINEELETSKEELESTNEELTTVNEEMATRNAELNRLNSDLHNLQASTRLPLILLARDATVRSFSVAAEKVFNLIAADVGRPFGSVRHRLVGGTPAAEAPLPLEDMIRQAIDGVSDREEEVRDEQGRWHLLRIRPYFTVDKKLDGAVLVLVDIDDLKRSESEARSAREYAEGILRTARDAMVVLRADLRVDTANNAFYEAFATTPALTEGRPICELVGELWNHSKLRALLEEILPRNSFFNDFEMVHEAPSRGRRILLLNGRRLDLENGAPPMILLAIEDVTERRSADVAAASLAAIVNSSDDAIIGEDLNGNIVSWNRGAERLFGYPAHEAIGRPVTMLFTADKRQEELDILKRIKEGEEMGHFETVSFGKGGSRVEISLSVSPVRDADDRVIGASKICRDITERKRAEEALRQSEERYRNLFNSIDEGFCVIEIIFDRRERPVDYRFVEVNPSFATQTGLSDVVGKRMLELAPDHEADWFEIYGNVALTGKAIRFVNEARSLNNRWFDVYAFRVAEPETRRVGVLFNNITARRLSDEALRLAQVQLADRAGQLEKTVNERTAKLREIIGELEGFSYSITHDLRAPLRALQGFSQLLEEGSGDKLDDAGKGYLRRIANSAERMDQFIQDVLTYSRTLQLNVKLQPVDAHALLRGMLESYPDFQEPKAEVVIKGELPPVLANETALTQCFSNLLYNAVKFVPPNAKPRVQISAERRAGRVRFWIVDQGIGVAERHFEKIFELFQRLDTSYEGTGIGLAIVRKVADRVQGQVGVESELGRGSRFWLELKAASDPKNPV